MVTLSANVLEGMGFKKLDAQAPILARFWLLHVGRIQGLRVDGDHVVSQRALEDLALPCTVSVGSSLNHIVQSLLGDDFADDESAWCKERDALPPFVVTIVGPTRVEEITQGWWKDGEASGLVTYESFGGIKSELRKICDIAMPRIYAALTIQYADKSHPVKLRPIETIVVGRTTEGQTIHDLRIQMSATGTVSSSIDSEELSELTVQAIRTYTSIDSRVATFLYSGEIETDQLKRFLHYFVALEISTHSAFKLTDESSTGMLSQSLPENIVEQGGSLLRRQYGELRSLVDRFVWCAATLWPHVGDRHVVEFKRLKKIRDDVAHGNTAGVAHSDAEAARNLVLHVLRAQRDSDRDRGGGTLDA